MSSVAFIIPHMGREQLLIQTLDSIVALDKGDVRVEAIVVSKNDSFSEQLRAYKDKMSVEFFHVDKSVTISDQRNIGVTKTNSDYLAFIDADISLSSNWLNAMQEVLNQDQVVLASAMQIPSNNPSQLEHLRVVLSNLSVDCEMEFLPGRNLYLSRQTFDLSGGFPSELVTCEDYVFTQRVHKHGKLFYSSTAQYVHLGEDQSFWPMAKKEIWRGQSNLASIKGRKVPVSEYPSFIAPPLFTSLLLLTVLSGVTLNWELFTLSGLMLIGILGLYTFRLWKKRHKYPSLFAIVWFYILYFPARTIGTILGAAKNLQTSDYK